MAERIQVELVDDIDGSSAQHTVTFALDGVMYEIDLNDRHVQQLRSVFDRYIKHARTPKADARASREQERKVKEVRQANTQVTEQIRGAARRTRDHLSKMTTQTAKQGAEEPAEEQPLFEQPELATKSACAPVPVVVMPQFSSAVD